MSPVFGHGRLRLYLLKLLEESPRHGYEIIRELEDRFMGLYTPSAGTVYPRLARLTAEGLVTVSETVDGRKVYTITDAGRAELAARRGELDDLEEDIDGSVRDLAEEIRTQVHGSVRDLKAELKDAARQIRRESRGRGRSAAAPVAPPPSDPQRSQPDQTWAQGRPWTEPGPGGTSSPQDGDDVGEWFRAQAGPLLASASRWSLSPAQRSELKGVLARALDEVRRILTSPPTNPPPGT